MKLSPQWVRDFIDLKVDALQLAHGLTGAGITVEGVAGSGEDAVFDMEITTNRPDAMNHYGVARECSAIYDLPLKSLEPKLPASSGKADFAIEIGDKEGCARYTARIIRGVIIKASPENVAKRLTLVGQRSINNAADATNYTLWEMGHPTHVFDLDLLEGGKILVRRALSGETLKTLDGVERKLTPEDLVIADAVKPVALAGVMGGFDTMITDQTRNILIESAWFDPVITRKMARRHGLHTDASHRFERGADYGATPLACARVAERILESGGGKLQGDAIDAVARDLDLAPIILHVSEVKRILGGTLPTTEIIRILRHLGFELLPEPGAEAEFTVRVPSWRLDVEREIDLIEEIARLHGYDKFSNTLPAYSGAVAENPESKKDEKLRSLLLALGYNEAVTLSFISHEDAEQFSSVPVIELENPLSEEASVMRTSMVPGMLNMLAYNLNRGTSNARLFESASVFEAAGVKALELKRIVFGATGNSGPASLHKPARPLSFFDMKGDVESLLCEFQSTALYYDALAADYYHPGRSARAVMDGATVAQFGQLNPDIAELRKLRQDVFIAEIFLDRLYKHALRQVRYEAPSRYPAVERDFSFLVPSEVGFEKINQAVTALRLSALQGLSPVEIFRGGKVPAGKYSLLLRANFQSSEVTLREDEVAQWSAQIVSAVESLGGSQRA
ncbi:MAG TPA: phenylalanine--tRNA ligase subunit beta [Terriglobales bacterium]|jgi:phenylalanyl-tRNA synthetase beta chain|nr:phenylalanine--tRNA ligase subunit beta [Terriglobales bacterium]